MIVNMKNIVYAMVTTSSLYILFYSKRSLKQTVETNSEFTPTT